MGALETLVAAGEVAGNIGSAGRDVGDVEGLVKALALPAVSPDEVLRRLSSQPTEGDAQVQATEARIESTVTYGTGVGSEAANTIFDGTINALFTGAAVKTTEQGITAAGESLGVGAKILAGLKDVGLVGLQGVGGAVAAILAKAVIALNALDFLTGIGGHIAHVRLDRAQAKAKKAMIAQVQDLDRTNRIDAFVNGLLGEVASRNPEAAEKLKTTWNSRILELLHKRQLVLTTTQELDRIRPRRDGLLSVHASKEVARAAEGYHTDLLPDPQTSPENRAKDLERSNFVQAKRVRGWDNRATTFNALVVLTIGNLQQALQQRELNPETRRILEERIARVKNLGVALNRGWRGIGGKFLKDAMISRPVIHWNDIQPAVREIQQIAVDSSAQLAPRQLETITQLTQNLQVPSLLKSIRSGRRGEVKLVGTDLLSDFRQTLDALRIDGEDVNRVDRAEQFENHLKKVTALGLAGAVGKLPSLLVELNDMAKAEGGIPLGVGDYARLMKYLVWEGRKLRNPTQDKKVAQITRDMMHEAWTNTVDWAVGEEEHVVRQVRNKIYDFITSHFVPFYDQISWVFSNRPFEDLIPTPKVPGEK